MFSSSEKNPLLKSSTGDDTRQKHQILQLKNVKSYGTVRSPLPAKTLALKGVLLLAAVSSLCFKRKADEKAKQALTDLSNSLGGSSKGGDVENPYMRKAAPSSAPASLQERVVRELKNNWWLWGSIAFAVLLLGSLVVFRESLYDSAKHGLPFLAVKEYAADSCAAECKEHQEAMQAKLQPNDADGQAKLKEQYDMCYTKCVAQETDKIVGEREQFKNDAEAELEKAVEEKSAKAALEMGATDTAGTVATVSPP